MLYKLKRDVFVQKTPLTFCGIPGRNASEEPRSLRSHVASKPRFFLLVSAVWVLRAPSLSF